MRREGLVLICVLASGAPAMAQNLRGDVLEGAARCSGIADDRVWLDCFYGSAQPMRARLGLPPAPAAQTRLVPPPGAAYMPAASAIGRGAPAPRKKGFFSELLGSTKPTVNNMPMSAYSFDRDGRFTVRLSNGQTYIQAESDLVHASWRGPAGSHLVTIQPSGDKYTLKVKGEADVVYRVRRR